METGQKHSVKTINISKQDNYKLSIQVSLNGLSFCILNTDTNCITTNYSIAFKSKVNPTILLDKLKNELSTNEKLQRDFSSVSVIHNNELATLVPNVLFTKDHLADYLKFNAASAKMTEAANAADGAGQAPTTSKRSAMRIQMQMPRPFVHYTR